MGRVQTGLERLIAAPPKRIFDSRIGILCNPASIDRKFRHIRNLFNGLFPGKVTALFSPQHGFYAEKQDNMIESDHRIDSVLQVPVFSLYGETRKPSKEMFDHIDTLIVDLQDAGTRVYTFIYTMAYCLEAAKQFGKKVLVLDRPNPINGVMVEGNCLSSDCVSFVGRFPIPMRHGLTIGEISLMFNNYFGINCDLEVFPMKGWNRSMFFQDTGLPWVPPSPNLPTPVSAMVYPGQVMWEGTNVSEGRGTTQPFELFGAPYISTREIISLLDGESISGVHLREVVFEPTSNKWKGEPCNGFQIHIIDPFEYKPYITTLKLLQSIISLYRDSFEWKMPPYEYEYEKLPADLIIGDTEIRRRIEKLDPVDDIAESWTDDLDAYLKICREFYLYGTQ
ncbi:exo-beta-N-acetylmuramidase NamZ domain-containing protein [Thermodesulfobacteriota bacterium]